MAEGEEVRDDEEEEEGSGSERSGEDEVGGRTGEQGEEGGSERS